MIAQALLQYVPKTQLVWRSSSGENVMPRSVASFVALARAASSCAMSPSSPPRAVTRASGSFASAGSPSAAGVLHTLYLDANGIGDEGAQALAERLNANTTLRALYLARNLVTDDGAREAARAMRDNTTLGTLSLAKNQISKACRRELRSRDFVAPTRDLKLLL